MEKQKQFEVFPEGKKQSLEARDLIVYKYMQRHLLPFTPYTRDQIFDTIKHTGIDEELKGRGFPKLTRMGSRTCGTNLISTLNNLWWNGLVRKYARGFYELSGHAYGVEWELE